MLRCLVFSLFSLCCSWLFAQEPVSLSLRQAEDLAVQNNFNMNASLHRLEQGYYGYRASKNYFYPTLQFSADGNFVGNQHGWDNVLSLTQPIFDRAAYYTLKESQIQWEQLRLDVQTELCDLLFQVREAFYEVVLNQAHLAVDQSVIKKWEEELYRQERQLELGVSIPYEVSQTKLNLKNAWIDFYATQKSIRASQLKLLTVLGMPPETSLSVMDHDIPIPPCDGDKISVGQWQQLTLENNPELKKGQFEYLLSQVKIKQSKAARYPTFSLYADVGHNYIAQGYYHDTTTSVGVNMNWTLYDATIKQRVRQAKEGSCEAASNYYQLELETKAEVYNLQSEIEHSYQAYLTALEGVSIAEEGMQIATKKHQIGAMTAFEYREAIKSLREAQQTVNQAKFDIRHAYDKMIQHSGKDLTSRIIEE